MNELGYVQGLVVLILATCTPIVLGLVVGSIRARRHRHHHDQ